MSPFFNGSMVALVVYRVDEMMRGYWGSLGTLVDNSTKLLSSNSRCGVGCSSVGGVCGGELGCGIERGQREGTLKAQRSSKEEEKIQNPRQRCMQERHLGWRT